MLTCNCGAASTRGLPCAPPHRGHPAANLSFVAGSPVACDSVPQQRPGAVAVLDAGGCDDHVQDQAGGIDGDVALAAVDLLGRIPAPRCPGHRVRGAHGLRVDHRGGGLNCAPGRDPDLGTKRGVQPGQGAIITPGGEPGIDGLPGREISGQIPPGAAGAVQVQDRLNDPPPDPLGGQMRHDHLPLGIGQVTGITPGPPRPARTLGMRRPACFPDRHKSGSLGPRLASQPSDTPPDQARPARFVRRSLNSI